MTLNVSNFSPAPGTSPARGAALAFNVTFSPVTTERPHIVRIAFGNTSYELVFDGEGFVEPYVASSRTSEVVGDYRYTIRRNGHWPSPPVVSVREIGTIELPIIPYSSAVDLTLSGRMIYAGENSGEFLAGLSATSGFTPRTEIEWFVSAGSAASVKLADNIDPDGEWADLFDADKDFTLFVTAITATTLVSSAKATPPIVTTVPTVGSPTVAASDLDRLIAPFSAPMQCAVSPTFPSGDVTGLSLGGTMVIARTLTGLVSGNGTNQHIYSLSGDLNVADAPTFVVGSSRTLAAMNGPKVGTGSTDIEITGTAYDWSAVANVSLWLRGDSGVSGNPVATWTGKNPPAAIAFSEATNKPAFNATGANGHESVDFDGTNDLLTSAVATTTTLLGATSSAFCIVAAIEIDAAGASGGTYASDAIIADHGGYWGLLIGFVASTDYRVIAFVDHGGAIYDLDVIGVSLPAGGRIVVHMRLSGGKLYAGINGVETAGTNCSGTVSAASDSELVQLGASYAAAQHFNGRIGELVVIKSGTLPTAGIAAMVARYV